MGDGGLLSGFGKGSQEARKKLPTLKGKPITFIRRNVFLLLSTGEYYSLQGIQESLRLPAVKPVYNVLMKLRSVYGVRFESRHFSGKAREYRVVMTKEIENARAYLVKQGVQFREKTCTHKENRKALSLPDGDGPRPL